jgi:hypothetical protein
MVPETKNVLARTSSDLLEPKRAKDVAPTQKYQPFLTSNRRPPFPWNKKKSLSVEAVPRKRLVEAVID